MWAVGHGEISIKLDNWVEVDSRLNLNGTEIDVKLGNKYKNHLAENSLKIKDFLKNIA